MVMSISMNMGKLLWQQLPHTQLELFTCVSMNHNSSAASGIHSGHLLRSHFPAKSTNGPHHWHCKRTVYAMHMMPSKTPLGFKFVSLLIHKIHFMHQGVYWPHVGLWWAESQLYWMNGLWSGKDQSLIAIQDYCFLQHTSPLLSWSYIFLLIVH